MEELENDFKYFVTEFKKTINESNYLVHHVEDRNGMTITKHLIQQFLIKNNISFNEINKKKLLYDITTCPGVNKIFETDTYKPQKFLISGVPAFTALTNIEKLFMKIILNKEYGQLYFNLMRANNSDLYLLPITDAIGKAYYKEVNTILLDSFKEPNEETIDKYENIKKQYLDLCGCDFFNLVQNADDAFSKFRTTKAKKRNKK